MKRISVGIVLVVAVLAGGSWMWLQAADRKANPPSRLPDAASRAVQKAVPDADIGDIDENEADGERRYDVELRRRSDGREVNVEVTPDGQITVESTISTLRKKLDRPGGAPLIHTRRGMGYVLGTEIR